MTEVQLVDIHIKALGRLKFVKLCERNGVKKAWDEKKFKEDKDGSDFISLCTVGTRGTPVARRGEHLVCASGASGTVATTEMAPYGAQGVQMHVGASAIALVVHSSTGTIALAVQAPCSAQWHAGISASAH